jgi:hypothetical protein
MVRGTNARESLGPGLDHCLEIVATICALLLQLRVDLGGVVVVHRLAEYRAIRPAAQVPQLIA